MNRKPANIVRSYSRHYAAHPMRRECDTIHLVTDCMVPPPRYDICNPAPLEPDEITITINPDTVEITVWSDYRTRWSFRRDTGRMCSSTSFVTAPADVLAQQIAHWLAAAHLPARATP